MLEKLLNNKLKIGLLILLVSLLASIRAFENMLFYDPFSDYFKSNYLNLPFPTFNSLPLFIGMIFRYFLNTIVSLALIYVLFKDKDLIKVAFVLYLFFCIILMIAFFLIINFSDNSNNFILFYVRRFLIQPLFVLLFIPAFFYQKQSKKL